MFAPNNEGDRLRRISFRSKNYARSGRPSNALRRLMDDLQAELLQYSAMHVEVERLTGAFLFDSCLKSRRLLRGMVNTLLYDAIVGLKVLVDRRRFNDFQALDQYMEHRRQRHLDIAHRVIAEFQAQGR